MPMKRLTRKRPSRLTLEKALNYGFNTIVEHIKIINRGVKLVVEGARPFKKVVDRKIFYPLEDNLEEESDGKDDEGQD